MRNPNGYGCVKKMTGKRRKPFAAVVTSKYELEQKKDISFLKKALSEELYAEVKAQYDEYCKTFKAVQKQKVLGYFKTKKEAMLCLAEFNKNPYDLEQKDITFKEIYDILLETKLNNMNYNTKRTYENNIKKCVSLYDIRISKLKKAQMQSIIDEHSSSKSLQNQLITLFKMICGYAIENDIISKDYSKFLTVSSEKKTKKREPFSISEINLLFENIDKPYVDIVLILIFTGLRIGELLELKSEDVHIKDRYIDVKGTKTANAERLVPIHKSIIDLLIVRKKDDFILTNKNGDKTTYPNFLQNYFGPLMKDLGMEHTPHECRHTFATLCASSNLNLVLTKKMLGHSSNNITEDVYTHIYIDSLVAEIDKISLEYL